MAAGGVTAILIDVSAPDQVQVLGRVGAGPEDVCLTPNDRESTAAGAVDFSPWLCACHAQPKPPANSTARQALHLQATEDQPPRLLRAGFQACQPAADVGTYEPQILTRLPAQRYSGLDGAAMTAACCSGQVLSAGA